MLKSGALLVIAMAFSPVQIGAAEESSIMRDAHAYADCTQRLDLQCAIPLIYVDGYLALGEKNLRFKEWRAMQSKYFDLLRSHGGSYTMNIQAPTLRIKGQDKEYAFLPCQTTSRLAGDLPYTHHEGFVLAVSDDGGRSWMFMDALEMTEGQLRIVVPEYSSQPLPLSKSWRDEEGGL